MRCPNCGAEIDHDESFAHFVICEYCQSTIILDGKAARLSGQMAVLHPPRGALFVGASGSIGAMGFNVLGRVRYGYAAGYWDEWFLGLESGESAWLAEDEDRLILEECVALAQSDLTALPTDPGSAFELAGRQFTVRERGIAVCEGGEGQLPFAIVAGEETNFLDLYTEGGAATLELEGDEPKLFVGRVLETSELVIDQERPEGDQDQLKRERAAGAGNRERVVKQSGREIAISCESCGGALDAVGASQESMTCSHCGADVDLEVERIPCPQCAKGVAAFGGEEAQLLSCGSCHTRFELKSSGPSIIAQLKDEQRPQLAIKLGMKARLFSTDYRVVGQLRYVEIDEGKRYYTNEFLLYTEAMGYRWLSIYQGHFVFFREIQNAPPIDLQRKKRASSFSWQDEKWRVFEKGHATIDFVDGELPWVASVGDENSYLDAIAPPQMLSAESTKDEISWSRGIYIQPEDIAEAFDIPLASLSPKVGVGAAEPYFETEFRRKSAWVMAMFFCLALILVATSLITGKVKNARIFVPRSSYQEEFITTPFKVHRDQSLCSFNFSTKLQNAWAYFDCAVLDEEDRVIHEFSAQTSYYSGVEGGERWSEGQNTDDIALVIEKAGDYRLLLKGEGGRTETADNDVTQSMYDVTITLKERIVLTRYYLGLILICCLGMAWSWVPKLTFEARRMKDE